jgi:EmrB/QacA subfamily drug resistance transporter
MATELTLPKTKNRPTPPRRANHRWLVLALVSLAQLMVVLDVTVVTIALPSAQKALGFTNGDRQWVVTAYALAFGSLLPLGGRIGDLFGRRYTFLVGLVGFAGISAFGGAAQSFGWLLGARALQGAFGALLAPSALAILSTTFQEPSERARAFAVFGAVAGSGAAVGLLLGGVITEYLSWRWCLYINVALAAPAFAGGLALLHGEVGSGSTDLDLRGAATATGGLLAVVYGLSHAQSAGWSAPVTILCLAGGVALLMVFLWLESKVERPLLPLRVVADRTRGGSYLAVLLVGIGIFGVFLFLTYYLQENLHYSPVKSGFAFLPLVGAVLVASISANTIGGVRRLGPRLLVAAGMVIGGIGLITFTGLGAHASYATEILPGLLLAGAGLGFSMSVAMNCATAGVAADETGIASALANTSQQIGGSIGTALLNTIATSATASFLRAHPGGKAAVVHATLHGYSLAYWVGAGIFFAGAAVCGAILRSRFPQGVAAAAPAL